MIELKLRKADLSDKQLYFEWANDDRVRKCSFNQQKIKWEEHVKWFECRINDSSSLLLLFSDVRNTPVGQIRFENKGEETIIGISIDPAFRGLGLGSRMLHKACEEYKLLHMDVSIVTAYIRVTNTSSIHIFNKAGFINAEKVGLNGVQAIKMIKSL